MNYGDIRAAREEAEATIRRADEAACQAAALIRGRLRVAGVDGWTLRDLKRELQAFDAKTKTWKEPK